tara:strand:- start:1458 stop:1667 length:210 start_codon:yes stop_codon:yes gene_type:complete
VAILRSAALALEFGFVVGVLTIIGIFGGNWLDENFGVAPVFLLGGILLGLAGSGYVMYMIFKWQQGADG